MRLLQVRSATEIPTLITVVTPTPIMEMGPTSPGAIAAERPAACSPALPISARMDAGIPVRARSEKHGFDSRIEPVFRRDKRQAFARDKRQAFPRGSCPNEQMGS